MKARRNFAMTIAPLRAAIVAAMIRIVFIGVFSFLFSSNEIDARRNGHPPAAGAKQMLRSQAAFRLRLRADSLHRAVYGSRTQLHTSGVAIYSRSLIRQIAGRFWQLPQRCWPGSK